MSAKRPRNLQVYSVAEHANVGTEDSRTGKLSIARTLNEGIDDSLYRVHGTRYQCTGVFKKGMHAESK